MMASCFFKVPWCCVWTILIPDSRPTCALTEISCSAASFSIDDIFTKPVAVRFSEYVNSISSFSTGNIFVYLWIKMSSFWLLPDFPKFSIFTGLFVCWMVCSCVCFSGEKQTVRATFALAWRVQLKYFRLDEFALLMGETAWTKQWSSLVESVESILKKIQVLHLR